MAEQHAAKGNVTLLRVSPHYGYGPPGDHLDAQVVITIDTQPGMAFGFNLTAGSPELPSQLAMLATVRDAYIHKLPIGFGYSIEQGKKTGLIFTIDLASQ